MKRYSTRYRRRLCCRFPAPYRPDRIERGMRILRAFRLSLRLRAARVPHQCEFEFALAKHAASGGGRFAGREVLQRGAVLT